jgi:hypothetical protein
MAEGLLGLTLNQGRPVSRGLAQYISQGLRYLTIPYVTSSTALDAG